MLSIFAYFGHRQAAQSKIRLYLLQSAVGASKSSESAQMQGVKLILQCRISNICKQEIYFTTQQLGYNTVAVKANLQVMPELKSEF